MRKVNFKLRNTKYLYIRITNNKLYFFFSFLFLFLFLGLKVEVSIILYVTVINNHTLVIVTLL